MIFTLYGDYISQYGDAIWIGSLIRLLEEFGHNEQSVRAAASRMSKQGWIESLKQGNKSYYYLTERGKSRMNEAANRIYQVESPSWDGNWRILVYSIPEKNGIYGMNYGVSSHGAGLVFYQTVAGLLLIHSKTKLITSLRNIRFPRM